MKIYINAKQLCDFFRSGSTAIDNKPQKCYNNNREQAIR